MNMTERPALADALSAAFEQACKERDMEIADHLFQALEVLSDREENDSRLRAAASALLRASCN